MIPKRHWVKATGFILGCVFVLNNVRQIQNRYSTTFLTFLRLFVDFSIVHAFDATNHANIVFRCCHWNRSFWRRTRKNKAIQKTMDLPLCVDCVKNAGVFPDAWFRTSWQYLHNIVRRYVQTSRLGYLGLQLYGGCVDAHNCMVQFQRLFTAPKIFRVILIRCGYCINNDNASIFKLEAV